MVITADQAAQNNFNPSNITAKINKARGVPAFRKSLYEYPPEPITMILTGCPIGVGKASEHPRAMVIRSSLGSNPVEFAMDSPMGARMIGATAWPAMILVRIIVVNKIKEMIRNGDAWFDTVKRV